MTQHVAEAPDDGKSQTETAIPCARSVVELLVIVEYRFVRGVGNADAGITHLDAQHPVASAATEQNLAGRGVFPRIRKEVAYQLLEQTRFDSSEERRVGERVFGQ